MDQLQICPVIHINKYLMIDSFTNDQPNEISLLIKELSSQWQKATLPQSYQLFFLAYFPHLTQEEKEAILLKQIKQIKTDDNYYSGLVEQYQIRTKVMLQLEKILQGETVMGELSWPMLSEIIQFLSQLRNANLVIIERLLHIHRQCMGINKTVPDNTGKLLREFDSDNNFMKSSFLAKFILFGQDFDPFFLYHYQHKDEKSILMKNSIIQGLSNMDITYAARIRKIQQKSLRIINNQQFSQSPVFKRKYHSQNPSKRVSLASIEDDGKTIGTFGTRLSAQKFKIKHVSKQKGTQALRSVKAHLRQSIIKHQKIKVLTEQAHNDDELQQPPKNKSINSRYFHHQRSRYSQALTKPKLPQQQVMSTKCHFYNFRQKLPSINNQSIKNDSCPFNSTIRLFNKPQPQQCSKFEDESDLKSTSDSVIRDIRMRATKMSVYQISKYLRSHAFNQQINKQISFNNYSVSMFRNQSYFSQFLINGELKIIAISIELPDGDYLIRVWHPVQSCSENTSKFLLSKYLQYLQRATCDKIYYYGLSQQPFLSLNFTKIKDQLFVKDRVTRKRQLEDEYPQFLSFKCSNILFPQQNTTISMLYSDQIENFNENNYYVQPTLVAIDRESMNPDLLLLAKINDEIKDMKALNCLLEDEKLDTFAITSAMNIGQISAIRLSSNIRFADNFVTGQGYFKFQGQEIYRQNKHLICKVQGSGHNFSIVCGKGFANIHKFIKEMHQIPRQAGKKPCEFIVKMFSKQLYGRMVNNSLKKCGYGNWEFSLNFKDQLQGRIKHNMQSSQKFGPEPFYFAIKMGSQILFSFQVKNDDFLY